MNKIITSAGKKLPWIFFGLLLCAQTTIAGPLGRIPEAGQLLPEIVLPSLDGKLLSTTDLCDKPTVLHVFASW